MVMTPPLSTMLEIAEVLVTMFDPAMRGTYEEPPPKRVIICNVFDHMTCESFLLKTAAVEQVDQPPQCAQN